MAQKIKGEKWFTKYVAEQLPELTEKVVVITGTTQGAGYYSAVATLRKNAKKLYLFNRESTRSKASLEKLEKEKTQVGSNTELIPISCDLSSFDSVKAAVTAFKESNAEESKLDVLVNNAGILDSKAVTDDGYLRVAQVNLIAPYILAALLMDDLKRSSAARIVYMTSGFRHNYSFSSSDFNKKTQEEADKMSKKEEERLYSSTRIASGLLSLQLNKQLNKTNVIAVTADPGLVRTEMLKDHLNPILYAILPANAPPDGCLTQITAAYGENVHADDLLVPKGFMSFRGRPKKAIDQGKPRKKNGEKKLLDPENAFNLWQMLKEIGQEVGVPEIGDA